jgi:hypothetical protein
VKGLLQEVKVGEQDLLFEEEVKIFAQHSVYLI